MKFQNRSDVGNFIDVSFHYLAYMPFFIQRLRL